MKKCTLYFFSLCMLIACQKEALREAPFAQTHDKQAISNLKTTDHVMAFLAKEMPDQYHEREIARIRTLLDQPIRGNDFRRSSQTVELPAGSENGLQAAVDEAGPGGTVLVKAGNHIEEGLITISHRINLFGEDGAVINLSNSPSLELPFKFIGGIRILNADRSRISGIEFTGAESGAGGGILIEDSDRVMITNNQFINIQNSIIVQKSNHASIKYNEIIQGIPELLNGAIGIVVINGKSGAVIQNKVSGTLFGIWACDKGGISWANETSGNFYGQILCKVPPLNFENPDGVEAKSDSPGNHWLVALNESSNNFYAGYVVIDGANNNTILANKGSGNAAYDVDLVGDSMRFGFLTPTSYKNRVWSFSDQTIKDCGQENRVVGGIAIDITTDPCM